jgi:hypothetical protein
VEKHVGECWDVAGLLKQDVTPEEVWGEEVVVVVERRKQEAMRLKNWIL